MRAAGIIGLLLSVVIIAGSCQSEQELEFKRYYSAGATVYQAHCQNCHGNKGQGLADLIPSLTDSVYLKSHKNQLACYLQNGLKGKIIIHDKTFEDAMPATTLSPMELAQVLTYVTNSFGNKMGLMNNDAIEKDLKGCK